MEICSFIAGQPYRTSTIQSKIDPFTGESQLQFACADLMGAVQAIQAAARAYSEWKDSGTAERLGLVSKIRNYLAANADLIALREAQDQGLRLTDAAELIVQPVLANIDRLVGLSVPSDVQYSPVGPILILASWNLSLRNVLDRLVPALLAGNSVVIKLSSAAPGSAQTLTELIEHCKAPAGLINVLLAADAEVKSALMNHPGIRAVSFSGRIENAEQVITAVSKGSLQNFKKLQVSSGTKNVAVALGSPGDVDFAELWRSFMVGQGQLAWNSARLFVLEKFEQEWSEKLADELANLRPAESVHDDSVWGPLIKASTFSQFEDLKKQAFEDKAKLIQANTDLAGDRRNRFLPPVFTKDMSRCSTLQQDQVHSPFFILSVVKYPFDVAKYANVSYYGGAAHLFGEVEKFQKVASQLEVGLVAYNRFSARHPGAFAQRKQSGFGLQDFSPWGSFFSQEKKFF